MIHHFTSGQNGCRSNEIPITRASTNDGSISEINQCNKGNIFAKYDAFNPKAHNLTQILHIFAPLSALRLIDGRLLLKDDKTEFLVIGTRQQLNKLIPLSSQVGDYKT